MVYPQTKLRGKDAQRCRKSLEDGRKRNPLISQIWIFRHPKSIERTSQDSQIGRSEKKKVWGYKCVGWVGFVAE